MPIDIPSFWQQVALGEDSDLELKEVRFRGDRVSAPRRDDLADAFAAFANAQGGRLVLGIDDDRQPQSLDASRLDVLADFVKEVCSDKVDPALDPRFYRVPVPDSPGGRGVLVVDIAQGITVHRSPGGHFRRRGDSRRQMGADEIRRLSQSRGQSDIAATDTQIVRGTSINSLRAELWRSYASSRTAEPAEVVLGKLKFLKGDAEGVQRATVGGVLLGADIPTEWLPNAYIQAVCYKGVAADGATQLDAQDLVGPLDRQIRDAMRFVVRNRRVAASKRPGRIDVPQYSERAVFEALVNAVVHRDYSIRGSRIRLFMFDDRLELYSPGGLCNSMTTEDLRTSQFTRNELIASRLGQCPVGDVPGAGGRQYFIERRGEGVAVIEDETFAVAGRRPTYELIGERELLLILPAASPPPPDGVGVRVAVEHLSTGDPVRDAHVLLIYPNNTYLEERSDAFGHADFELHSTLPMTVFCAAPGFQCRVVRDHVPGDPLELALEPAPDGGSLIIPNRTGDLPGIHGRLNPILDNLDRSYLYADNVAIDDGRQQPVHFRLNEPVRLTDSLGANATVWFREMVGASCVFDFRYER